MFNLSNSDAPQRRCVWVNGPVIVGAGPAGLAVAAGLKSRSIPFIILEKSDGIASLWRDHTYSRLKLHLPKQFCELPGLPFPDHFPEYPSRVQFITYLDSYSRRFGIEPRFSERVESARYDGACGLWRVRSLGGGGEEVEYVCQWVVVATGENAERVVPEVPGMAEFEGEVIHVRDYKTAERFAGKRVAVVGCGNSGMEVCLDLCDHGAKPFMVVRSQVHVLPREICGKSTFELAMLMLQWLPLWVVDKLLLFLAWIILGNTQKYGLKRPSIGPLELKNTQGKTPVLDVGTLDKIKSTQIKVVPEIKKFSRNMAELVNGERLEVDAVIFATGYRSNVAHWLQESEFFSKNGFPKTPYPKGWKGQNGLYAVGFTRRGLAGVSADAVKVAEDIGRVWKNYLNQKRQKFPTLRRCISTF